MKPVQLEDVEKSDEVDEVTSAIRAGRRATDWVRAYSANGKHSVIVRRDPVQTTVG